MPRFLLPLLLCVSLLTGAVGSVWAATVMALPAPGPMPAAVATPPPCHEADSAVTPATDLAGDADNHTPCGQGQHCACVQHAHELRPWQFPLQRPARTALAAPYEAAMASLPPARLIRPPIG